MGCRRRRFRSLVNSCNSLGATMSPKGHRNHIASILAEEDVFVGVFVMFSVHKLQEVNHERCAARRTATKQSPRIAYTRHASSVSKSRGMVCPANRQPSVQCAKTHIQTTRPFARQSSRRSVTERQRKRKLNALARHHLTAATLRNHPPLSKEITLLRLARAAS